jgi:hypothetical protein
LLNLSISKYCLKIFLLDEFSQVVKNRINILTNWLIEIWTHWGLLPFSNCAGKHIKIQLGGSFELDFYEQNTLLSIKHIPRKA